MPSEALPGGGLAWQANRALPVDTAFIATQVVLTKLSLVCL